MNIVFISRIHKKKNLLYAIEIVQKLKGIINFDIYGPIEQKDYWKQCETVINKTRKEIKIEYKGIVEPMKINEIFDDYDCMLFPTLSENYGHIIAESVLNNCPIIISKNTTPWDDVDNNGGYVIDLQCQETFVEVLNNMTQMNNYQYNKLKTRLNDYKNRKIDIDDLKIKYTEMFNYIIEDFSIGEGNE